MASPAFYNDAFAIVPDDANPLPRAALAIAVGGAGTLKVITGNNKTVTLNVTAGQMLPLRVTKVFATGTSATNLTGLVHTG